MNKVESYNDQVVSISRSLADCCEWIKTCNAQQIGMVLDKEFIEPEIFGQWLKFCAEDLKFAIEYDAAKRRVLFDLKNYRTLYHIYLAFIIFRFCIENKVYCQEVLKIYGGEVTDPMKAMMYVWIATKQRNYTRGLFDAEANNHFPVTIFDYWDLQNLMKNQNFTKVNGTIGTAGANIDGNRRTELFELLRELNKINKPTLKQLKQAMAKYDIS